MSAWLKPLHGAGLCWAVLGRLGGKLCFLLSCIRICFVSGGYLVVLSFSFRSKFTEWDGHDSGVDARKGA